MTTKDLQQIATLLDETLDRKLEEKLEQKLEEKLEQKLEDKLEQKLEEKFEEKLTPIHEELKKHGKMLRKLKKDQDTMLRVLDTEQMNQWHRLDRIEKHLGFASRTS